MKNIALVEDCCPPLLETALSAEDAERMAVAFRVVGDPTRLRLLSMIATHPGGEVCACELVEPLGLSQPTVSHHLKVLFEAGLLGRERRGTWVFYRVFPAPHQALRSALATPQLEGVRAPR
ncbi:MAG: metalloregulator ArsR/SmtB family transcription factor [Actinomycetota bacterium]|nr:metalloregulator ArsR/SmtB family transcription factor [Actinomycetota bacterium]